MSDGVELTIKVKVDIESRLSDTGDEDTKAISISKRTDGNNDTDQDVISGEFWHGGGGLPLKARIGS